MINIKLAQLIINNNVFFISVLQKAKTKFNVESQGDNEEDVTEVNVIILLVAMKPVVQGCALD